MDHGTLETPARNVTEFESEKDTRTLDKITAVDSSLPEIDSAFDRAITRKFDAHLLPWLFGLWLLAFIDRTNIGLARIDGLSNDLRLGTGDKFNIVRSLAVIAHAVTLTLGCRH